MKRSLLIFSFILILSVTLVFTACWTTPPDITVDDDGSMTVAEAIDEIYTAMIHSCTTDGATEGIYVAFSGEKRSTDSELAVNPHATLYDFGAKIYIDSDNLANDTKSIASFTVREENGGSLFSLYYSNGILYIDYPPILNKIAIHGLELGNIVNTLNQSKVHDGKVSEVVELIPILGNYIFTDCKKVVLDKCNDESCNCIDHFQYICTIDFSLVYSALENVLTTADLGIDADMLLGALDLTKGDLNRLSELNTTVTFEVYNTRGGADYYYFKNACFESLEGTVTDSIALNSFTATEFTEEFSSEYSVPLADNLSTYKHFDFRNFDLSGTVEFDFDRTDSIAELFGSSVATKFTDNTYTSNYSFKSNFTDGEMHFCLSLDNVLNTGNGISFYFDGNNYYIDATALLGETCYYSFDKEYIEDKLEILSLLTEPKSLDGIDKAYLIVSLLDGLKIDKDKTVLEIGGNALELIKSVSGYDFAYNYNRVSFTLDTSNNLFKSLSLALYGDGLTVNLSATTPTVGYEVSVIEPLWIEKCQKWNSINTLTPVISGRIETNITHLNNAELVSSLISSLSGENVTIDGEITDFVAECNFTAKGALDIFKLSFYGSENSLVCSIYYKSSFDMIYVIFPEQNGTNKILSLNLLDSGRYASFLGDINGNALVTSNSSAVLKNDANGLLLSAGRDGANEILSFISRLLPDKGVKELPIDFAVDTFTLSIGNGIRFSTLFAKNKRIDLIIDDITLEHYDLSVKTKELGGHDGRTVSIFDVNDLSNTVTVEMNGKESATLIINVSDIGGWHCDNVPSLGAGVREVNAYIELLGQRITETVTVDFTDVSEHLVNIPLDYIDYVDNSAKTFIFDGFNSAVDPIKVLSNGFNTIGMTVGTHYINKSVIWTYGGKPIDQAVFTQGSEFRVTPSVIGFFGDALELNSCAYTVKLTDTDIDKIENAESFMDIYAYAIFDPFDTATYSQTDAYVLTKSGKRFKADLLWDTESIHNRSVKVNDILLTDSELVSAMKNRLFSLDGTYEITAYIINSLGVPTELKAMINIFDRIINNTRLVGLNDGISIIGDGILLFDQIKIPSIDSNTVIAREVELTFSNGTQLERAVKWEIPVVKNVPLYSTDTISGSISLIVGDDIGGYQSFEYPYVFKNYNITSISLYSGTTAVATENEVGSMVKFELLNNNPYDFSIPDKVVMDYSACTLTVDEKNFDFDASSIIIENIDWNLRSYNDKEIWYRGEHYIYGGVISVADMYIELSISFVKAVVENWSLLDADGNPSNLTDPILTTPTYVEDSKGEYVLVNGRFVIGNETHIGLKHYRIESGIEGLVYYRPIDGDTEYSITIDPNRTHYLCYDSYPSTVRVSFKGITDANGQSIYFDLPLNWDLSSLTAVDVASNGYYEKVPVYIPLGQRLADIRLWISSKDPNDYYFVFDSQGEPFLGDVENNEANLFKTKIISVKLLDTDLNGNLVVHNLNDTALLHSLICGCDNNGCMGKLYFEYADANTVNSWFDITEWIGLDDISKLYRQEIAKGVSVNEVSGRISLTAKVGNIICSSLTLSIEGSPLVSPSFDGYLPLANSSVNNSTADIYSMTASGTDITVDPYLVNASDSRSYPKKVSFYLDGVKTVARLDGWNCDIFVGKTLYLGVSGQAQAVIQTIFGDIEIPCTVTVRRRVVDRVYIDGVSLRRININAFDDSPFGESIVNENGRVIAYKAVEVKFTDDDRLYYMMLKYDITGMTADCYGGLISSDIDAYIGNDAGGYQLIRGYSVYSVQNTLESITTDNEVVREFIADGKIYSQDKGFASFDGAINDSKANLAWKELVTNVDSLTLTYSYYKDGIKVVKTVNARNDYLSVFAFDFVFDQTVYLKIWNGKDIVGSAPIVSIDCGINKPIMLFKTDLELNGLALSREYDAQYTAGQYLIDNPIESNIVLLDTKTISVKLLDAKGGAVDMDSILTVGDYTLSIVIEDGRFVLSDDGINKLDSIELTVTVTQRKIDKLTILNGDRNIFNSSSVYEIYEGASIALAVVNEYDFDTAIELFDSLGNKVTYPESVGNYTVKVISLDKNYTIINDTYTLIIKSRENQKE